MQRIHPAVMAAFVLVLASCGAEVETTTTGSAATEPAIVSSEGDGAASDLSSVRHGTTFDGTFAGPFDGTTATLGSCERALQDGEIYEGLQPFTSLTTLGTEWLEVISVDVSEGREDPSAFSTIEGLSGEIEFAVVPGSIRPDYSEALVQLEPAESDQWFYAGEQLSAIASELDRGQRVFAAATPAGWALAASVSPSETVRFVGFCTQQLSDEFIQAVDYANRDGNKRTQADVFESVMVQTFEKVFPASIHDEILSPTPTAWIDQDPMKRQIDLEQIPQDVLETLTAFTLTLELPPSWLRDEIVVCPRQDIGWTRLCVSTLAHENGNIGFEMLVQAGDPVEVWLMDKDGLNPRGPIFTIEGIDVRADAELSLSLSADDTGSEIYNSTGRSTVTVSPTD